jgi:hypothetical protein
VSLIITLQGGLREPDMLQSNANKTAPPGGRGKHSVPTKPFPLNILPALALLVSTTTAAGNLVLNSGTQQVTLLELYTSQGCSSCPVAERWLNEFIDDDDLWGAVVPVAFHVDYWDYIGWKDTYASPEYGERQRDYARAGKARTVYTPGLFANGREWRGWTLRLRPRASDREPGNLAVVMTDRQLVATFPDTAAPLKLHVALLGFGLETRVERGENRKRRLEQEFVVLAHATHVSVNGRWEVPFPHDINSAASRYGIAVWVSEAGNPVPLQATGGWLPRIPMQGGGTTSSELDAR